MGDYAKYVGPWALAAGALSLLVRCSSGENASPPPCTPGGDGTYVDEPYATLSQYCFVSVQNSSIVTHPELIPFAPTSTLFSDYATKDRSVWIPKGQSATYRPPSQAFDFPVGSVIVKSFGLPDDLRNPTPIHWIETRLLIRKTTGWFGISYVWDDDHKEAHIRPGGQTRAIPLIDLDGASVTSQYLVPSQNQCEKCHGDNGEIVLLGVRAGRLNSNFDYSEGTENQLAHWTRIGALTDAQKPEDVPVLPAWADGSLPASTRARAYLDSNCGHCHSETGEARTTGLYLRYEVTDPYRLGVCKSPVAAGNATGDLHFDVVPGKPDESILLYRMKSTTPAIMMPEIGRSLVHAEGVDLVSQWIAGLPGGDCVLQ